MTKNKTIIIAEAGVNHNGSLKLAKKMIKNASKAGADFVKFQIFFPDSLSTAYAKKPDYVKNIKDKSQLEMLKKLKLSEQDLISLKKYSKKHNIKFLVSVFDEKSLSIFKKLKLNLLKIPSGEINNIPLLQSVGKLKKKIIEQKIIANKDFLPFKEKCFSKNFAPSAIELSAAILPSVWSLNPGITLKRFL